MTVRIKCNTVWASCEVGTRSHLRRWGSGDACGGAAQRRRQGGRSMGEEGATSIPGVHSFASFFNPHTFSFGVI